MKEVYNTVLELGVIMDKIYKSDIVSFDIFDTLLLRNVVHPTDIFRIVEIEYRNRNDNYSFEFHKYRINAEEIARQKSPAEEIELDEIYHILSDLLGSQTIANELKQLEIEMESRFLVANGLMRILFNKAKELGKKILIISDMYLPRDVVSELLHEKQFFGYQNLYVSSESKLTKASGNLYKEVRKVEQIPENAIWFHIGDNRISDVENARKHGMDAYYFNRESDYGERLSSYTISESIARAIQINQKYKCNEQYRQYWYRFGVDIVAPLYVGLMFWLETHMENKSNLFFLSRDGYMPCKLYELMRRYNKTLPEGKYIYASRRAYIYPSLRNANPHHAVEFLTAHNPGLGQKLTTREVFENMSMDLNAYKDRLVQYGLSFDDELNDTKLKALQRFLLSIWEDIEIVLCREYKNLESYFRQVGITQCDEINIFDIGWSGSTQSAIQSILTEKIINGYYFGTLKGLDTMEKEVFGYIFHWGRPRKIRKFIMNYVMMFELIFTAPEGSLIGFQQEEDGEVVPILKNVEKNKEMYNSIENFQNGAMEVFKELLQYKKYLVEDFGKDFVLSPIQRYVNNYKVEDMLQFAKLTNFVGIGNSDSVQRYVSVVSLNEYLQKQKVINKSIQHNLWRNAIVIKDEQGRHFNRMETERLYKLRRYREVNMSRYILLIRKAVKNPRKAIRKLLRR